MQKRNIVREALRRALHQRIDQGLDAGEFNEALSGFLSVSKDITIKFGLEFDEVSLIFIRTLLEVVDEQTSVRTE